MAGETETGSTCSPSFWLRWKLLHRLRYPDKSLHPRVASILWNVIPPLLFIGLMFLLFPVSEQFQFNTDEGIQLIKALLTNEGYSLYGQIWSDQPPLLNTLLVAVIKIAGYRVSAARLLILALSAMLLWANFHFMRIAAGRAAAIVSTLLLLLLPKYLELSISVMVGLPAIAFAVLALLSLALWHQRRSYWVLLLSAALFSLSIFTKLFTGFLGPIFLAGLVAAEYQAQRKNLLRAFYPAFVWGVTFALSSVVLLITQVGLENIPQLVLPHLQGQDIVEFQYAALTINHHLVPRLPLLLAALLGAYFAWRERQWLLMYPLAWMVSAYVLLFGHAPVWDHQQLLVTVPAVMLAPIVVMKALKKFSLARRAIPWDWASVLTYILFIFIFFRIVLPPDLLLSRPLAEPSKVSLIMTREEASILNDMSNYSAQTHWVVADIPMYAYWIRKPVPPELAVFTMKRLLTGNLTQAEVIDNIIEYQPEQVLLGRMQYEQIENFLQGNYTLLRAEQTEVGALKLFIRTDILQSP